METKSGCKIADKSTFRCPKGYNPYYDGTRTSMTASPFNVKLPSPGGIIFAWPFLDAVTLLLAVLYNQLFLKHHKNSESTGPAEHSLAAGRNTLGDVILATNLIPTCHIGRPSEYFSCHSMSFIAQIGNLFDIQLPQDAQG